MWTSIGLAFEKAFGLLVSPTPYLNDIIKTTMFMAFNTTLWSSLIGITIGCLIALKEFKCKKVVVTIVRTLMGFPPVAMGILLYLLFSSSGPLGAMRLLYSVPLMIIAQVCLISPIVVGMTETALSPIAIQMRDTTQGLRFGSLKKGLLAINEGKGQLLAAVMFAFARSIAEVGAVQIVGGSIMHSTEVMTTVIMGYYNTGNAEFALAVAIILLLISLMVNVVATMLSFVMRRK